jgi:hypothetical protein
MAVGLAYDMTGPRFCVGDGWLKMVLDFRSRRRLKNMQAPMIAPSSRMAPNIDPTTMPAMAPPDRAACGWDDAAVELAVAVEEGKMLPIEVVNGRWTFAQRVSVPE